MKAKDYDIIVATVRDGRLYFGGSEWDQRTSRQIRGCVVFADISVTKGHLYALLMPGDRAAGKPGGGLAGITLRGLFGPIKVIATDAWGLNRHNPDAYRDELYQTRIACAAAGIEWRNTAGATVANMLLACDVGPGTPGRWRGLAMAGLHAGPIVHITAGYERGSHIDRRQAYCHAMQQELPSGSLYQTLPNIEDDGISVASVAVPASGYIVPPLPINMVSGRVCYPTGTFRGVWHNSLLRYAVETGTIVKPLRTVAWSSRSDSLSGLARRLMTLPTIIRKPLYTRVWGKMASVGGWTGTLDQQHGDSIQIDGLWWHYDTPGEDKKTRPVYRPDIAGAIVNSNLVYMMEAANSLTEVSALHVDAIWTSDNVGAKRLCGPEVGHFKLEETGRHRQYAAGVYHTECDNGTDVIGYSGWKGGGVPTLTEFKEWASKQTTQHGRTWLSDPKTDDRADSRPIHFYTEEETLRTVQGTDPFCNVFWDRHDMRVKEAVSVPEDSLDV